MRYSYVIFLFILFQLASCSSQTDPRKAIINFKADLNEFNSVKTYLQNISKEKMMQLTDNSYQYGTKTSPQTRLILELKGENNLLIYTNCYSDWEKCFVEFLCYKTCTDWRNIVSLIQKDISNRWVILNTYNLDKGLDK